MRPTRKRMLLALFCALLMILGACAPKTPGDPGSSADPTQGPTGDPALAPKGRYLEETLTMPEGIDYPMTISTAADGSIYMLGAGDVMDFGMSWSAWRSTDSGATWVRLAYSFLNEPAFMQLNDAAFDENGTLYASYYIVNETEQPESPADETPTGSGTPGEEAPADTPAPTDDAPTAGDTAADSDAPDETPEDGSVPTDYFAMPDIGLVYGDETQHNSFVMIESGYSTGLLVHNGSIVTSLHSDLLVFDVASGTRRHTISTGFYPQMGASTISNGELAIAGEKGLCFYDLMSGELTGELALPSEVMQLTENGANYDNDYSSILLSTERGGDALILCNSSGIYRVLRDGSLSEQVVDGGLTSLGMPSIYTNKLVQSADGSYLVLCLEERDIHLFRYAYDPNVSRVPATELSVYSLHNNKTIRQAVGKFQLQNPDVKINYKVGIAEGSGITEADALRTLSMELLSGKGPDVLVLDGMPLQSYVQKGVLKDLTPLIGSMIESGELLPNIAKAYEQDGALYAVPARFTVPLMMGNDTGSIKDPQTLADYLKSHENKTLHLRKTELVPYFYKLLAPRWFDADGMLDAQAFQSDLEAMRALGDTMTERDLDERFGSMLSIDDMFILGINDWYANKQDVALGTLRGLDNLTPSYSYGLKKGAGELTLLPKDARVFNPVTILGINAASTQQEVAQQFVTFALSKDILVNQFGDGLPVNRAALEANSISPYREGETSAMSIALAAGDEEDEDAEPNYEDALVVELYWPDDALMQQILRGLEALDTPVPTDAVVKNLIISETEGYMTGGKTLEQTMNDLVGKLELYLAE